MIDDDLIITITVIMIMIMIIDYIGLCGTYEIHSEQLATQPITE